MNYRAILDAIAKGTKAVYHRPRRKVGIRFPTLYAVQYKREIAAYIKRLKSVVDEWMKSSLAFEMQRIALARGDAGMVPIDDTVADIESILNDLEFQMQDVLVAEAIRELVVQMSKQIFGYNRRQWTRAIMLLRKAEPLLQEQPLLEIMRAHIHENVRLISSIPTQYLDDIERIVFDGVRAGKSYKALAKAIDAVYPTKRAKLIAVDQIGSYYGALAEEMASQSGLETYIWRDRRDTHVRGNPTGLYPRALPSHWARNGFVFSWVNPPEGGHPGMAPLCRCWAQIQEAEAKGDRAHVLQPGAYYDGEE